MTATEHVGWLAGGRTPAALHLPELPGEVGVVLSAPLGQEQVLAYRAQRLLAIRLAEAGIAVARHENPGFGDSTVDPGIVPLITGAADAASALRSAGCTRIVLVGLASGALIASAAADADPEAAGLVLWDPPGSGREWLRRARSLFRITIGDEPPRGGSEHVDPADDVVDVVGAVLPRSVAAEIAGLGLAPGLVRRMPVAVAVREERNLPAALAPSSEEIDVLRVPGHEGLLDGSSIGARIPGESVDTVLDWIVRRFGSAPVSARGSRSSVSVPVTRVAVAGGVEERMIRLGEHELVTVETRPIGCPPETPVVIFHNGSVENRTGVARNQVLLARRLAAEGIRAMRVDRRGEGETGPVTADEPNLLFTAESIDDGRSVLDALALPADRVMVAGLCSGAWIGLTTSAGRVREVVAVSVDEYRTRPTSPDDIADRERATRSGAAAAEGPRDRLARLVARMPHAVRLALARRGHGQIVEALVGPLVASGADVTLVLVPRDLDVFERRGGTRSLRRLRHRAGRTRVVRLDRGDHSVFGRSARARADDEVFARAKVAFADSAWRAAHPIVPRASEGPVGPAGIEPTTSTV